MEMEISNILVSTETNEIKHQGRYSYIALITLETSGQLCITV